MPNLYWSGDGLTLYHGDCRAVLAELPAHSVSTVVTSPPFYGLRRYDCEPSVWGGDAECEHDWVGAHVKPVQMHDGAGGSTLNSAVGNNAALAYSSKIDTTLITTSVCSLCGAWRGVFGNEPTVEAYVEHTIEVLRALRRVMRKDGVLWWDIDDSRSIPGKWGGQIGQTMSGGRDNPRDLPWRRPTSNNLGVGAKNLLLIPQRVALAAQADGWIIRSDIKIMSWMPESARDRPTDAYRTLLMMTPSPRYYYDSYAVRVQAKDASVDRAAYGFYDYYANGGADARGYRGNGLPDWQGATSNLGNVWSDIPPAAYPDSHFATYSVEEPLRCIMASTPEQICNVCGKPRVRIIGRTGGKPNRRSAETQQIASAGVQSGGVNHAFEEGVTYQDQGFTDCGHGDYSPGVTLDPFVGTGTSLIAARQLGRQGIGIDASGAYLGQAVRRLTLGDAAVRRQVEARRNGYEQAALFD